jgi:exopolyphosphatase/guanosine-5'-triphosphate,3'-diphosphate pyrophosphatase
MAVLIQHARNLEPPPDFILCASDNKLVIEFTQGWADSRPLTVADLDNERDYLANEDFELEIINA